MELNKVSRREFLGATSAGMLLPHAASSGSAGAASPAAGDSAPGWWMRQPIRWIQNNLRVTNAALDPQQFVDDIAASDGNVLLMSMGGIFAFYPSQVELHDVSPYMPEGRDTFGEVLRLAHARGIRVIGRFDFSKTHKDAFDAHPDWFFRRTNGEPVVYNGLYMTCVNGGWYQQKAGEILNEALTRYDVDGLFFNMFGNSAADYSGHPLGLCHCQNCVRLFRERFHRDLPEKPDADYQAFMHEVTVRISEHTRQTIKAHRPEAALVGTAPEIGDIVYSESNTAVTRPLPLWPYSASDNVNRARNTYPQKMAINQCMTFVSFAWRFSMVPEGEIRTRLWQNVANGGGAAFCVHGTLKEQQDRTGLEAIGPIFRWLKEHQDYFVGQYPVARVLVLGAGGHGFPGSEEAYRGVFRLLSEEHIPFGVIDNIDALSNRECDLVITTGPVPEALQAWVENGGRLLVASPAEPPFAMGNVVKRWQDPDGAYFRVRDKSLFPSMRDIDVAFMYGNYLQVDDHGPLTFIPPSRYGPPELVNIDWKDTDAPGLILKAVGKGKVAWMPWEIGTLYYRHSSEAHARLMRDLVDHLLPDGRQLKTNAHPLVAITLMKQGDQHQVHLVNLTGHADTAYFSPAPLANVQVQVKGTFRTARALMAGTKLSLSRAGAYSLFTVQNLDEYEMILLA